MGIIVISALLVAFVVYMTVGFVLARGTKGIADILPLGFGDRARVRSSGEFSASTVATTISLATVVIAFFDLAGQFGLWLFWTVLTTSVGLLVVRVFASRIWHRMGAYDHRPTLHEFLGTEFNSEALSYVSAVCTSMGFLAAFAVELTVGSLFFAWLVPGVPSWIVVMILSAVAFIYTAAGGFRAVIVTDRIQMLSIWLLLIALPAFYIYYAVGHGGWSANIGRIPEDVLSFSYRPGLIPFLLGIFIINVPTFISDMSIWQRIAGADEDKTVVGGLWSSVFGSAVTWSMFAILACLGFMVIGRADDGNPLVPLLNVIGKTGGVFAGAVLFFVVLGLYGAMLSTASTQLIAVSHTIYEDVFSHKRRKSLKERLPLKSELMISRSILIVAAVISTLLVQLLGRVGFSVVDLVFAIYGAQVGLCPLVISGLLLPRERLAGMSDWAASAVSAGFVIGWGGAAFGRVMGNANIVFLAPAFSLGVSTLLLCAGFFVSAQGNRRAVK